MLFLFCHNGEIKPKNIRLVFDRTAQLDANIRMATEISARQFFTVFYILNP